jgi:ABC-2 type transport system permease protein
MSRIEDSSLVQLTLMRLREFFREPESLFWTFLFPVLLALALGIAFREGQPQPARAAVVEAAQSGILAEALAHHGIAAVSVPRDSADALLRRGDVAVIITQEQSGVRYRIDPTRPESHAALHAVDDAVQRIAGRADPVATRVEEVRVPGSRYIDWLVPGLIGLTLLGTGLWGVGFTIVNMRKDRLLKRLMATPMARAEFLASFFFGRLLFLGAEVGVLLGFAWLVFGVQVRGSLLALAVLSVLGAFSFTGLGLLVASRARTTEGVSGLMNAASFPMWVLSGVFFSYTAFPDSLHPLIRALPLTAFNDAARSIMNEGLPLLSAAGPMAVLTAWGVASFMLALAIFRWQ